MQQKTTTKKNEPTLNATKENKPTLGITRKNIPTFGSIMHENINRPHGQQKKIYRPLVQ